MKETEETALSQHHLPNFPTEERRKGGERGMSPLGMSFHREKIQIPFQFLLMFWYEGDSLSRPRERLISTPGFVWEARWLQTVGAWDLEDVVES